MPTEPTASVKLTAEERAKICSLLKKEFSATGGVKNQPVWIAELYTKLAYADHKPISKSKP